MISSLKSTLAAALLVLTSSSLALADDYSDLAGKWSMKRKTADGQEVVQKVSFKEKKFTFRLQAADGTLRLYAEGEAQVQSAGNIKVLLLKNIKGGQSESETQSIDEEFHAAFRVSGTTLFLTSNLDKERNESPRLDEYRRE